MRKVEGRNCTYLRDGLFQYLSLCSISKQVRQRKPLVNSNLGSIRFCPFTYFLCWEDPQAAGHASLGVANFADMADGS